MCKYTYLCIMYIYIYMHTHGSGGRGPCLTDEIGAPDPTSLL